LDEHLEEQETVDEVEEESIGEYECNYRILKSMKKYIFHPGSISLYLKNGKLRVLRSIWVWPRIFKLGICRRYGDNMMSIRGEIKKFVRDALESRGVVQEVRTVEVGLDELKQYLRNAGLDVGDLLETLMDMMRRL
jgi:hypothetical protein